MGIGLGGRRLAILITGEVLQYLIKQPSLIYK